VIKSEIVTLAGGEGRARVLCEKLFIIHTNKWLTELFFVLVTIKMMKIRCGKMCEGENVACLFVC
jgi:hypothetical protein